MKGKPTIAVAGANEVVGREIVTLFGEQKIPFEEVRLLAADDSAGEIYDVAGDSVTLEALDESALEGVDFVLFTAGPGVSQQWVPAAAKRGATVIDCSGALSADPEIPVLLAGLNDDSVTPDTRIIAIPAPAVAQLVPLLKIIRDAAGLKRVVVSTYESASGAGEGGLDELWEQTLAVFNQRDLPQEHFSDQIAFNLIPVVGSILESGHTREEGRFVRESRKLLGLPELRMSVTEVRVPVLYCCAESVNIEMEHELLPAALSELLKEAPGIELYSGLEHYPMPLNSGGTDTIHVGRVRRDESVEHGLNLWVVADNVRCGSALSALKLLKRLIEQ